MYNYLVYVMIVEIYQVWLVMRESNGREIKLPRTIEQFDLQRRDARAENEGSPDISLSIEMIARSLGLSFADNCVVVVISLFADRKLCWANLRESVARICFVARVVVFHATLLRTIAGNWFRTWI